MSSNFPTAETIHTTGLEKLCREGSLGRFECSSIALVSVTSQQYLKDKLRHKFWQT